MNDIILIALPQEAPSLEKYKNVFFTGVGKINASIIATKIALTYSGVSRIINFGTAGGLTVSEGLHKCGSFIQRDIDCSALGFKVGETPYDIIQTIEFGKGIVCSTGDNFVTNNEDVKADVVDMEAYSIAKVCKTFRLDFQCFKYVSDRANDTASKDWKANVSRGENYYIDTISKLNIKLVG